MFVSAGYGGQQGQGYQQGGQEGYGGGGKISAVA